MNMDMPRIVPVDVPGPDPVDLPGLIRQHGAARPDHPAIVTGEAVTTWGGLAAAMDRVAAHLIRLGLRHNDVVASLGGVTPQHLTLYLGTLAAGGTFAPLMISATPQIVAGLVANCDARLIFADAAGQAALGDLTAQPLDDLLRDSADATGPLPVIAPTDGFDIIYSSGTTGAPKGIMHDHRFRGRQRARMAGFGFDAAMRLLVSTPVYSNTTLAALLPMLAAGGTAVLMPKFDAGGWLALAARHRITHAMCVPVQWRRLLAHPDFDATDLSHFVTKLSTSAPLTPDLSRDLLARFPGRMVNIYGMTEGGVGCLMDLTAHPDRLDTVGQVVAGGNLMTLGPDDTPLPQGEVGEIVGRSVTMMTGYCNAPELTRKALWTDPDGVHWMRSGDMGRVDADGFLHVMDRTKDMINSGGFNIFAVDLENALLTHPAVAEAAVIAVPSPEWGETPLAYVTLRAEADPEALRTHANARLGKTQRISRVIVTDALPRSEIGKVLKRDLRAPHWPKEKT
ncbi:Acyl-CoA synthetase (AMP-forming)/AMP-acid ligase II [Loktanella atrilutea]|uniref:Acyl-CoA synthetase (AMP-forming)/AMP-acid ligase II n=2 Tax=Loktanella atrilutea TaxID=366533 RepID=A0A1M5A8B7_LOKAT|nr:Acyl-CoA synthetase (AMP-forming)/AMP-acid ligase II [Loktanella atrilutea]